MQNLTGQSFPKNLAAERRVVLNEDTILTSGKPSAETDGEAVLYYIKR